MKAPNELCAVEAARAIATGSLTSEALTRACLERIEARESEVEAWIFLDPDEAIAQAKSRDRDPASGPLHGLPVGLKDIIETVDMPTAYGSPIYLGHRPVADASCAALVRAAGGVVLGKTVTTEFACTYPGKTRNPHNPAHTPGGSSSGSAAAVADRMVPLAFGSQTGGSVIRPASFCGVVGYKPTYGQFSYAGVKLLAGSLDTLGSFARCVSDMALVRGALLGAPTEIPSLDSPPRLGLCRTPWWAQAEPDSQAAVESAARTFAAVGAQVRDVTLGDDFANLIEANNVIMAYEGRRALAYEVARHERKLSAEIKRRIVTESPPFADYRVAIELAERCRRQCDDVFSDLDALIVPSAVGEAPRGLESTGNPLFNKAWTTIGAPCVTLPGHTGTTGLPVGVQLVGPRGQDEQLLAVSSWAERALD